MGALRKNGIESAIELLRALSTRGGHASSMVLTRDVQLPRASFYRITCMLREAGLLSIGGGQVTFGQGVEGLLRGYFAAQPAPLRSYVASSKPLIRRPSQTEQGLIPMMKPRPGRVRGPFRVAFSNASLRNPWRVALVHAVEYAAARLQADISCLTIRHANDDAEQQAVDIEHFVADGVDGLIVSALSGSLVRNAISAAVARGIAVVIVDRNTTPAIPDTCFVTGDDAGIGHMSALWLAETMGGKGRVVRLAGCADAEPSRLRVAAAEAAFSTFREIEVLPVVWTNWDGHVARAAVTEILQSSSARIDGVWCDSGLQAVGSMGAFIKANYRAGQIPPHTGGDLNLAYKLAIRHRVKHAAIDYPPAMGIRAVENLIGWLKGCWVAQTTHLGSDIILTHGSEAPSVRRNKWAEDHVRWNLPDHLILGSGIGVAYSPSSFRIRYPGNIYNRSAASSAVGLT